MRTLALLTLMALAACSGNQVTITDDLDSQLDFFGPLLPWSDRLNTPYVRGTTMNLTVSGDGSANANSWSFQSSDPTVFSVVTGEGGYGIATGYARSAGSAVLSVLDGEGHTLVSAPIEVKVPDSAQIEANGPLVIGRSDASALVTVPNIVANGTATFLVRWFAGGVELHGNGVLSAESPDVIATPELTFWSSARDWLQLTAPTTAGAHSVEIFADGADVTALNINVVPASAVANISLEGDNESNATQDTWLAVLALATDAAGAPIYGVDYEFDVDGEVQEGYGDLFRYQYEPGIPKTLTASSGGMQNSATIHAGVGYVDSSNNIGCSSTGGASGTAELIALLGMAALLARKREATSINFQLGAFDLET